MEEGVEVSSGLKNEESNLRHVAASDVLGELDENPVQNLQSNEILIYKKALEEVLTHNESLEAALIEKSQKLIETQ